MSIPDLTWLHLGLFLLGAKLMWLLKEWRELLWRYQAWSWSRKHSKSCEGCEECDDELFAKEQEKWAGERWEIGLSYKVNEGRDPAEEDDFLHALAGEDSTHSGYCFTHGVRDIGWTFFGDYGAAYAAYHALEAGIDQISESWGITTMYVNDNHGGRDWDWNQKPGDKTRLIADQIAGKLWEEE